MQANGVADRHKYRKPGVESELRHILHAEGGVVFQRTDPIGGASWAAEANDALIGDNQ